MAGAQLWATNLSSAELTDNGQHPPVGLTQEQVDQAMVVSENYPDLEGIVDPTTGQQLVWREAIDHDEKLRRAGFGEWFSVSEEDEEEDDV